MKIDKSVAERIIREEASQLASVDPGWLNKIEAFSSLCPPGSAQTHIAFLGTSILAKACEPRVNLYEIRATSTRDPNFAYSARSLCHSALVPMAAELEFNLGTTGPEPLMNSPYFKMRFLGDESPIHSGGAKAFEYMLELIAELSKSKSSAVARRALRAFIFVRKKYQRSYSVDESDLNVSVQSLSTLIANFVNQNSERGRRAQAVVAGLCDVMYGVERVESGRVHSPSRKYPGDVCIRSRRDPEKFVVAFEVRDKPVKLSDLRIFRKKCLDLDVRSGAVVMVSKKQKTLELSPLKIFVGWTELVAQSLFWASEFDVAELAARHIEERLKAIEVSHEEILLWQKLIRMEMT